MKTCFASVVGVAALGVTSIAAAGPIGGPVTTTVPERPPIKVERKASISSGRIVAIPGFINPSCCCGSSHQVVFGGGVISTPSTVITGSSVTIGTNS
ncbi:hypothetical protein N9L26_02120 [Candidatus Pacebacteria bacterium]|nr:hypothetical protein [Candidatus Paceibacterota bacterium]